MKLVEVVVCVALLGLVIGFIVNLLPAGALGLQRANDLSAATAYGVEVLDNAAQSPPTPNAPQQVDVNRQVHIGSTDFQVVRTWYPVDGTEFDVVVTVQGPRGAPITLGTRIASHAP